ncbi:hypothetical protein GCM10010833_33510 [Blastomonas aquatica]|uniref:Uncharacterized protein n=1 Tax=Blastomonas aquatica TaxID=1510276 RepID=A0ABQ1JU42_9SPHN|nr:hypothetical protein GCM10010833_33510 [Blastomonas aquatica]
MHTDQMTSCALESMQAVEAAIRSYKERETETNGIGQLYCMLQTGRALPPI